MYIYQYFHNNMLGSTYVVKMSALKKDQTPMRQNFVDWPHLSLYIGSMMIIELRCKRLKRGRKKKIYTWKKSDRGDS